MCMLSAYALLKVVGYYDLSVLSMSVMGFQKKFVSRVGGCTGWGELYPNFFLEFLEFFNLAMPHSEVSANQGSTTFVHLLYYAVIRDGAITQLRLQLH